MISHFRGAQPMVFIPRYAGCVGPSTNTIGRRCDGRSASTRNRTNRPSNPRLYLGEARILVASPPKDPKQEEEHIDEVQVQSQGAHDGCSASIIGTHRG